MEQPLPEEVRLAADEIKSRAPAGKRQCHSLCTVGGGLLEEDLPGPQRVLLTVESDGAINDSYGIFESGSIYAGEVFRAVMAKLARYIVFSFPSPESLAVFTEILEQHYSPNATMSKPPQDLHVELHFVKSDEYASLSRYEIIPTPHGEREKADIHVQSFVEALQRWPDTLRSHVIMHHHWGDL